jgi:hypothetical protein
MRGPLLSGPIGSAATLSRVCQLVRERGPAVVLSAVWLAEALAGEVPVLAVVEPDKRKAAQRAVKRAAGSGHRLLVVTAGEAVPLPDGSAGVIVTEELSEIEDDEEAADYLAGLAATLRPGGILLSLDATKSPATEARLANVFLGAALVDVGQERPKEGALMTVGAAPAPLVLAARLGRAASVR